MTDDTRALEQRVAAMLAEISPVGRATGGGWSRFAWTDEDRVLREWFTAKSRDLGLTVDVDRAGNIWSWWGGRPTPDRPGVTTGSHLDSVPGGGEFDGPLGVVSALAAVELLQDGGVVPEHPVGVVVFSDEEGARFGIACFGSRVLTGSLSAEEALSRRDAAGTTLSEALRAEGVDPEDYGADPDLVSVIGAHIELHVEQGVALGDLDAPVGVASHIWPHGRWEVTVAGEANHAGTTPMDRRSDAMVRASEFVLAVRDSAVAHDASATVGRLRVEPNGVNVIPSRVTASLDVRAPGEDAVEAVLDDVADFAPVRQSWTPGTWFDSRLREVVAEGAAEATGQELPVVGTGAGHDAGVLQNHGVPVSMLFVRNGTGASHTPAEHADLSDCALGVKALAGALVSVDRWLTTVQADTVQADTVQADALQGVSRG